MPELRKIVEDILKAREARNQARNAKQKAVLLREAVRLGKERFLRGLDESRKEGGAAPGPQSKCAGRKSG